MRSVNNIAGTVRSIIWLIGLKQVYWQENEDAYHCLLREYYANRPCGMEGVMMTRSSPNWGRVPFQTLPAVQVPDPWQASRPVKRGFEAMGAVDPSPRRKIMVRGPGPLQVQ